MQINYPLELVERLDINGFSAELTYVSTGRMDNPNRIFVDFKHFNAQGPAEKTELFQTNGFNYNALH